MENIIKKRLFTFVLILIPVLFFIILEFSLRIGGYGENTDLFITGENEYANYLRLNRNVSIRYFSKLTILPDPPNDHFLKQKPENGLRIFVLGGSTAAGFPYGNNLMFSRILQFRLRDACPDKFVEVINTSISGINSYAQLDFIDEILDQDPDLILIYSGHNEYYGALGVGSSESAGTYPFLIRSYLKFNHYKTFWLLRNLIGKFRGSSQKKSDVMMMEHLAMDKRIRYESEIYQAGIRQFRENITRILSTASDNSIPVIMSSLVSNVGGQKPFVSLPDGITKDAADLYERAESAVEHDEFEMARTFYYMAKESDALRFRAPEDMNKTIYEICDSLQVPLVPMLSTFEDASPNLIIGDNLMTDHLHPNIDGQFLMAEAFFKTIIESKIINPKSLVKNYSDAEFYRQNWGYTSIDSLYGDIRIKILKTGWPFANEYNPKKTLEDYKPKNAEDELAYDVRTKSGFTLEDAHLTRAFFYEEYESWLAAYNEYYALLCLKPYNLSAYIKSADVLINGNQFDRAVPILEHSLKIDDTFLAHKWLGEYAMKNNDPELALRHFLNAYELVSDEPELLFLLVNTYQQHGDEKKAKLYLEQLKNTDQYSKFEQLVKNIGY